MKQAAQHVAVITITSQRTILSVGFKSRRGLSGIGSLGNSKEEAVFANWLNVEGNIP